MKIRIGTGFDVHQLKEGLDFYLGGIKINHNKGCVGHSDADVLIHAICDALLGAANLRDIGYHFPDDNPKYKDIDSKILLKEVVLLMQKNNFAIGNIDSTICLEKPKISTYIPQMQNTIAAICKIPVSDISIKATTTEKMGYTGRQEGISAYASCIIEHI